MSFIEQVLKVFWIFPVNNRRIIFRSSQGTQYNCNPKYISEYIENNADGKYEIVWVFSNPNKYKNLEPRGIKVVKEHSLQGIFLMMTAKFLVDNHGIQSYLPVRPEQEVINTWHGGGSYKKSYSNHTVRHLKYVAKMRSETTVFISSCRKFSECNLETVYKNTPEKILEIGMPRNDLLFEHDFNKKRAIKKKLGLSDEKKVVLYAPTFRDDGDQSVYIEDYARIVSTLEQKFGGKFVFAMRYHRFAEKSESSNEFVINVNY